MHAQELLTALDDLTPTAAARWVAAALAEAAALREHDDKLYPAVADGPGLAAAERLHAAWRQWADDAETLLRHVVPLQAGGRTIGGADDLDRAVGRARAM
jgi:hypothetical protein